MFMKCKILVLECFYFTSNHKINVERKNVVSALNVCALTVEVMQIHIFTKNWNNARFKQNLAVILTEAMYLDHRHPFRQKKSYFGQNVTYNVFVLRPKKNVHVCVFQVSGWKKKLGMVGRNNILFCQNILFSRWCQNCEAVRKTTWDIDSMTNTATQLIDMRCI